MRVIDTPDVSILHYLHRIAVVDDGHISAAMTYLDWQAASGGSYRGSTGRHLDSAPDEQRGEKWDKWHRLMKSIKKSEQQCIEAIVYIRAIPASTHKSIYEERQKYIGTLNHLGNIIDEIDDFFLAHAQRIA